MEINWNTKYGMNEVWIKQILEIFELLREMLITFLGKD